MFAFRSAARYSAQTTLVVLVLALAGFALTGRVSRAWRPDIPRVWDEEALADLRDAHEPGGFVPPGTTMRAIEGHEYGLDLTADERVQLIAFLRTL